jgi:flagellar hook-associated protein 3 FlgL
VRVTDRMVFDSASQNAARARERAEAAAQESATGVRVEHPWDDPTAAGLVVTRRASATRLDAIAQAASRGSDELAAADSALDSLNNTVNRARELAVQLANTTYSASERAAAADEVDGLLKNAIASLNVRSGNRYLLGGNLDAAPPFDASGTYQGDDGVRQLEVAPGVYEAVSVRADVAVKGVGGGVDVLATLASLRTALSANDVSGIQATLNDLDTGINQIATARATTGASMTVLDAANTAAKAGRDSETAALSRLTDADVIESASRLALAQRALDAALTSAAQSFNLTLLDKLS